MTERVTYRSKRPQQLGAVTWEPERRRHRWRLARLTSRMMPIEAASFDVEPEKRRHQECPENAKLARRPH